MFAAPARCQQSPNSGIRRAAAAGNPSAFVTSASLGMVALTLTRGSEEFFGRRNRASGPSWIAGEALHAATIAVVAEVSLDDLWHAVPSFPTRSELWLALEIADAHR